MTEVRDSEPGRSVCDDRASLLEQLVDRHAAFLGDDALLRPAAVYIVTDQWRTLRDRLGFTGLDALVETLAGRVRENLGDDDLCARFGHANLALLLAGGRDLSDWAGHLLRAVNGEVLDLGSESVSLTVSIGVCPFDTRIDNAEETLLVAARTAEATSAAGGNRFGVHEPVLSADQAGGNAQHMLELLTGALRDNTLRVVYQPLLPVGGESTSCFHMLPRLKADDGGLIPAGSFVPVAARHGLLPALDRWMLARALRVIAEGREDDPGMTLFVNQSTALLEGGDLLAWLKKRLVAKPGLAAGLVLDFRLDDLLTHLKSFAPPLAELRGLGAGVCLSGVDENAPRELLLEHLPADYLRMAPDLAERMLDDRDLFDRYVRFAKTAREAGRRIIIPMLENERTVAGIWRAPVDFIQGNFIQKPGDKPVFHDS